MLRHVTFTLAGTVLLFSHSEQKCNRPRKKFGRPMSLDRLGESLEPGKLIATSSDFERLRATSSDFERLRATLFAQPSSFQVASNTFGVPSIPSEGLGEYCRSKKIFKSLNSGDFKSGTTDSFRHFNININFRCPNGISRTTEQKLLLEVAQSGYRLKERPCASWRGEMMLCYSYLRDLI